MMLLLWEIACKKHHFRDTILTEGQISTVVIVRWESETPTIGSVFFEDTDGNILTVAPETQAQTTHEIQVAGLAADTRYQWHIRDQDDEETVEGETHPYQTGPAPDNLQALTLEQPPLWNGYMLAPASNVEMAVIWDSLGRPVWWYELEEGVLMGRAVLKNGSVWFNQYVNDNETDDIIYRVSLDQNDIETFEIPQSHHDFRLFDDGIAWIARDKRLGPDGTDWIGDQLMERRGGVERRVWSTWDFVTPVGAETDGFYKDGKDWTHCNGIDYIPDQDIYLLSCKLQGSVYAIHRSDGQVAWVLGGTQQTLELTEGIRFGTIHGPYWYKDQLWIFDNRPDARAANSRAVAFSVAPEQGQWAQIWEYREPGLNSYIYGNVQPREDGRIFMAWGAEGEMLMLGADGNIEAKYTTKSLGYALALDSL